MTQIAIPDTIRAFDMAPLAQAVAADMGIELRRAEEKCEKYRRVLAFIAHNGKAVPDADADEVHHLHRTLDGFEADCHQMFGKTLWHDPDFFGTPEYYDLSARTQAATGNCGAGVYCAVGQEGIEGDTAAGASGGVYCAIGQEGVDGDPAAKASGGVYCAIGQEGVDGDPAAKASGGVYCAIGQEGVDGDPALKKTSGGVYCAIGQEGIDGDPTLKH